MINILQVVHCMDVAGTERVVYSIVKNLDRKKFSFSICCLDYIGELGEQLIKQGFRVFCLGRRPGTDISLVRRLVRIIKEQKIDIMHAHQYTPYFYGATAAILSGKRKIIFTEHGRHQPDRVRPKRVICNQFLNLFTSKITGVSNFSKDSLVKYERLPARNIDVIYNGIRSEDFEVAIDRETKRREFGACNGEVVVGMIGRFDPIKNQRMLLAAFRDVVKDVSPAKLVLVGDGQTKKGCEDLVHDLGIEKSVRFLGRRSDVAELLSAFDIYVLPSVAEASSLTLLEAMAAGLPIVTTHAGGNSETVVKDKTGLLTSPGDSSEFARAIITLIKDPEKRRRMGEAGRGRLESSFTASKMLEEYENLYLST